MFEKDALDKYTQAALASDIAFLNDLLFWWSYPDHAHASQRDWLIAMMERANEHINRLDSKHRQQVGPKIRELIHILNGSNPLPEAGRASFLVVEKHLENLCNCQQPPREAGREPDIRKLFEQMWPKGKKAKLDQNSRNRKRRAKSDGTGFDDIGFYRALGKWLMYQRGGLATNSPHLWRYLGKADSEKVEKFFSQ